MGSGSINHWTGVGNLGRDGELRYTSGGQPVLTLNMACSETWVKDGAKQEKTEWIRVVYWGKGAEAVAEYCSKGKLVGVEGSITTRQWDDKDGNKRYMTEVKAQRITLLGGRSSGGSQERDDTDESGSQARQPMQPVPDDDDIPF